MLDDADKRHAVKLDTEKLWLEQLQDRYYEMDDVLDTWNTARIKAEIEKEEGKPADINAPAVVKKKCLPDYLRNTPLQHLYIDDCPILKKHCERGIGDYWPNISHIPNIYGLPKDSADSEMHDNVVEVDKIEDKPGVEEDNDWVMHDDVVEVDKIEDSNQVVEINIDEGDL
ncbi:hypothetical protein CMV_015845 [Castanea mollissima]|uniref:Uncharacterized protein n=1 Tax=Castanea mollissima TaxID=60419 RepID=A0A8J4VFP3_9ROSI|nr:hypothetical protein CMV_015845 [Castanea mollissima]